MIKVYLNENEYNLKIGDELNGSPVRNSEKGLYVEIPLRELNRNTTDLYCYKGNFYKLSVFTDITFKENDVILYKNTVTSFKEPHFTNDVKWIDFKYVKLLTKI